MLKKILLALACLVGLYLGVGLVRRALASDETKIRWLVETMEEAYDEGRPGTCVGPLAKDWHHEGYAVDREMLLGGLFQAARDRDRATGQLRSRVAVDHEGLEITVNGDTARLVAPATFERLRAGAWERAWQARFEAELERTDDGWKIVRSRHEDLAGTQLGR